MADNLRWNPVSVNFNDASAFMRNAGDSISKAGTVFSELRKSILDQEQRALDNAFREQQFRENVRQFDANYGLTKARDEESARHNKQTEINTRYATDVGAQSARYAADKSYAAHIDSIIKKAEIDDKLRAQQAASDSAAWGVMSFGSPELAQQRKAQALSKSQADIDQLKRERDELVNLNAERDRIANELYTNQNLTETERNTLGARYNAITNKYPDLPALLAQKDQDITKAGITHKEIENSTFSGKGQTDAETFAAAASAGVRAGGVMPSFLGDFAKINLQNAGWKDLIIAREKALLNDRHEITKAAINQNVKDATSQTPSGVVEDLDPKYQSGASAVIQKMINYAEKHGKRLSAQDARNIFDVAFGTTQEIIPMPWSPNLNKEPGHIYSDDLNKLILEDLDSSSNPYLKKVREEILGLSKSRNIFIPPTTNDKTENKNNK